MKILSQRTHTYIETFLLSFTHNGAGFSFDCDKDGKVDESKLNPCALESYKQCLKGTITRKEGVQYRRVGTSENYEPIPGTGTEHTYAVSPEIKAYGKHVHTPAVGECGCGRHVTLAGFTNTCECGADYNMSGQLLASRSQWGEETGESLSAGSCYDDNEYRPADYYDRGA